MLDESNSKAEVKQFRTSNLVSSESNLNLGNTFIARAGNDFITGGPMNDTVKAGGGDDEVYGGKGADTYIISPGNDKFYGFNVVDGDVVAIDSSASYSIKTFRKHAIIQHDKGSVLIKNISTSDLEAVIIIFG